MLPPGLRPLERVLILPPDITRLLDWFFRVKPERMAEQKLPNVFAEPGVGLVTNLFTGVGESHSGAIMENLQLNGYIAGGMALAVLATVGALLLPMRVGVLGEFGCHLVAHGRAIRSANRAPRPRTEARARF